MFLRELRGCDSRCHAFILDDLEEVGAGACASIEFSIR